MTQPAIGKYHCRAAKESGGVNYRGYFAEKEARAEAAKLADKGDDVYVGGVPAYSTLGYFSDPMLSTFVRYPDTEIARLIFHELAHQLLYAKDDTVFNESYAVSVEEEGLRRWLASQHDLDLDRQFETGERYRATFRALVERTRAKLEKLYASDLSDEVKRAGKAEAFEAMREEYEAAKRAWGGFSAYDYWFAQGPNNASLAAVGLYTQKVPQFQALLAAPKMVATFPCSGSSQVHGANVRRLRPATPTRTNRATGAPSTRARVCSMPLARRRRSCAAPLVSAS